MKQPTQNTISTPEGVTYPLTIAEKPTYYFYSDGKEATYIEHSQFIADNSFEIPEFPGVWFYPMLERYDYSLFFAIILRITHYEHKPHLMGKISVVSL